MTGPEDSHSNTRPISVAELLAKNGTIGAPPVGGRRRRRRGDTDSVTVAELTGEIPIVRDDEPVTGRTAVVQADEPVEPANAGTTNGTVDRESDTVEHRVDDTADHDVRHDTDVHEAVAVERDPEDRDDDYAGAVADYTAHVEHREADTDLEFFSPPRRSSYAPRRFHSAGVGAEQMSPDPVDGADAPMDLAEPEVDDDFDDEREDRDELPSYLRSSQGTLFGGQTVADDVARRGKRGPEDIDLDDERAEQDGEDSAPDPPMSSFKHAAWVVGQSVIAVAFGAGLFVAFDQLWKWNSIVALVLGVLVILGLVVGVRVVRKTDDIASTLIAVAVGALVTFGPLALLQAN
ncbi:hypothetical protein [Mycobacterium deserti]|uniref:FUSC family protein n=1 Tax=Mycobacterium deserti TaxID=2978347 RepID=A0ABT2M8E8_9MYCO|nr:hypothetical protein [Mycobacterium deserti]MCT7658538.1 hypothetical protein [Mycobacterium deserti]